MSGEGISSVSSHASSIELSFDFPSSRWAGVPKSPSMMSTSFNPKLTQKHVCSSSALRGRVAQVKGGSCVRALSLFGDPPETST